jgi:hypothetical protein
MNNIDSNKLRECEGCCSYIPNYCGISVPHCAYHYMNDIIDNCPCRKCLVKAMCKTPCSIYTEQCEKDILSDSSLVNESAANYRATFNFE